MVKILFFAHDIGGANAIFPLIEKLKKDNEIFVGAKGAALKRLPVNVDYDENLLSKISPDIIITGTSANDFTEKLLWKDAKGKGIKSIAVLDAWMNYGVRFSKYGLKSIDKFDKFCEYLPDYIIVMDDFAMQEAINDGIPAKLIYALGNPHFDFVKSLLRQEEIKKRYVDKDEKLILFASEPRTEDYGSGNELQALSDLLEVMPSNSKLVIRPHPKENKDKFKGFNAIVDDKENPYQMMMISDLVVSVTSMFLIEAMILKTPVISYQPFEKDKDKFILIRRDIVPFICDKITLKSEIWGVIKEGQKSLPDNFIKYGACERITDFIHKLIK